MQSLRSGSIVPRVFFAFLAATLTAACGGADVGPGLRADADPGDLDAGIDGRAECPDPEPPPEQCDFFLSCGCDVAGGQKCSINAISNQRACFAAGPKAPGATCSDESECEAGSLCAVFGGAGTKRCMQYCDDAHACPSAPTAQACYVPVLNVNDATVCGQVCDLRGQDCEEASQGCYPSARVSTDEKGICAVAGSAGQGAACTLGNDCAKGFTCDSGTDKCVQMCTIGGGAPACTVGTCTPLGGHTATGVCK